MVRLTAAVIFQLGMCGAFLFPTLGFAQSPQPSGREGFAGQQLFEHRWQWNERSSEQIAEHANTSGDALFGRSSRGRRRAAGLPAEVTESERLALGDGLGPLHNARSCAECHPKGGASGVEHNVVHLTVDPRSEVLEDPQHGAVTLRKLFPGLLEVDGSLLFDVLVHNQSTRPGYREIRSGLAEHVPGGIDDAWFLPEKRTVQALARRPVMAGRFGTVDFYLSQRNTPALFGLGRIEKVSHHAIGEIAARQPEQSGGEITGRIAGRFGWRGQSPSVSQIVADACVVELGLARDEPGGDNFAFRSREPRQASRPQLDDPADPTYRNIGVDMTQAELQELTAYVTAIPVPVEGGAGAQATGELLAGEKLFSSIGCEICHVPDLHPARGLFSDLLLHDMGQALQAPSPAPIGDLGRRVSTVQAPKFKVEKPKSAPVRTGYGGALLPTQPIPVAAALARPEQPRFPRGQAPHDAYTWDALEREWRTPPLWGIADTAPYLHDGRAATLEEAISWHGGEAESTRKRFAELSRTEKDLVLGFLASLRAPDSLEELPESRSDGMH